MTPKSKDIRIVKANRLLQAKVGSGPVDEKKVARSQKLIDENDVDFRPLARQYLAELQDATQKARKGKIEESSAVIRSLTTPVMQLKANAAMFNYGLIGSLANIMLNFLETINDIDKDVLDIIAAHQKTLDLIVTNGVKGDGGAFGHELTNELKEACKRYFAKHASAGNNLKDKDVFFIDG